MCGLNRKMNGIEERISEQEGRTTEITQSEQKRENILREKKRTEPQGPQEV